MATLQEAALTGLESVLQTLTDTTFDFQLNQILFQRLGLGDLIRSQDKTDPAGDVSGTRLRGLVRLTLRDASRQTVVSNTSKLLKDMLGTAKSELRQAGFLNLSLESLDRLEKTEPPNPQFEQAVLMRVDFEFIRQPEVAGDLIDTLDHEVSVDDVTEAFQIT